MENCEPLTWYGAFVLILTGGFIIVPYFRRKSDLISAWNLLLLGVAIFMGLGSFEAVTSPIRFHGLQWFEPTVAEVNWYLAASTVFLVALFASYYYDPISKAIAARGLSNWPPESTGAIFYAFALCVVLVLAWRSPFLHGITFVTPALHNISHKAMVFGCVFSFVLWYRKRVNVAWLALFIVVFLSTCLLAMLAAGGRRLLLSVFMGPILVVYYTHARHWRPSKNILAVGIAAIAVFIVSLMYHSIRHADKYEKRERNASYLIEKVVNIGDTGWLQDFTSNKLFVFSQQVVHYALITQRYVTTGDLEPQPLNTFKFLAVYPIPRRVWAGKPEQLGMTIVRDVVGARTSWGCGVAGQAAYEGGLLVAAMFGYLAAFGARLMDESLRRQPTNPYLIAVLASAGPHIVAWPRGDLGIMTIETVECFFFAIALAIGGRLLFGTERRPQNIQMSAIGNYRRVSTYPR